MNLGQLRKNFKLKFYDAILGGITFASNESREKSTDKKFSQKNRNDRMRRYLR